MNQQPTSKTREIISALAVLIVVVVIVGSVAATNKKKTTTTTPATTPSSSTTASNSTAPASSTPASSTTAYKDGDYTATGMYDSPGGQEGIAITITLKSDVVTDTTAKSIANDAEAGLYQSMFIDGYKQKVVGKNINSIKLSRVSGSSLTSQGFNNALQQIKDQAKA